MKRFSPAFDRNHKPIVAALRRALPIAGQVLEIGSGSGQHVTCFGREFPGLEWRPSDVGENLASIDTWMGESGLDNISPAMELDLLGETWPVDRVDAIVCINTVHIVAWQGVRNLFERGARILSSGGVFYVYGPYQYTERPLEPSNEQFDSWLKQRNPLSGIRDFEAVNALAKQNGLKLERDLAMPANNRSIWWRKL